jgi:hypothetical protein
MLHRLLPYPIFPNARLCVRNDQAPQGMETPPIPKDRGRDASSRYQDVSELGARFDGAPSSAARRLDGGDVDLLHLHHRIERALGGSRVGVGDRFRQGDRRDLPRQSPFVLAPAARALLAAIADDGVPVAIRFGLVSGRDLKRERFGVRERRSAVEPEARNAQHGKLDGQDVPLLPRREIPRSAVYRADRRIGKGLRVKLRRVLGTAVVPEADRVLCWLHHGTSLPVIIISIITLGCDEDRHKSREGPRSKDAERLSSPAPREVKDTLYQAVQVIVIMNFRHVRRRQVQRLVGPELGWCDSFLG